MRSYVAPALALVLTGCYASHTRGEPASDAGPAVELPPPCEPDTPTLVYDGECTSMEVQGGDQRGICADPAEAARWRGQPVRVVNLTGAGVVVSIDIVGVGPCSTGDYCGYEVWSKGFDSCACDGVGPNGSDNPVVEDYLQAYQTPRPVIQWNALLYAPHVRFVVRACPYED